MCDFGHHTLGKMGMLEEVDEERLIRSLAVSEEEALKGYACTL